MVLSAPNRPVHLAGAPTRDTMSRPARGDRGTLARERWFLEAPYELSIDAAFDFLARRRHAEFRMMSVQEILADDGTLERRRHVPGKPSIKFAVRRDGLIDDRPHVPKSKVNLKMTRQV